MLKKRFIVFIISIFALFLLSGQDDKTDKILNSAIKKANEKFLGIIGGKPVYGEYKLYYPNLTLIWNSDYIYLYNFDNEISRITLKNLTNSSFIQQKVEKYDSNTDTWFFLGDAAATSRNGKENNFSLSADKNFLYIYAEKFERVKAGESAYVVDKKRDKSKKEYDYIDDFEDGLARVQLNGKWGFIDESGREVVPCKYDEIGTFIDGLAIIGIDSKYGYIDKKGKELVPCKYDDIAYFFSIDGRASVKLNGKTGCVDKTGREIVPCKYDEIGVFSEELARVKLNDRYGFVDSTGKVVIPLKYDDIYWSQEDRSWFNSNGLSKVKLNGKEFYIDKNDNIVD